MLARLLTRITIPMLGTHLYTVIRSPKAWMLIDRLLTSRWLHSLPHCVSRVVRMNAPVAP